MPTSRSGRSAIGDQTRAPLRRRLDRVAYAASGKCRRHFIEALGPVFADFLAIGGNRSVFESRVGGGPFGAHSMTGWKACVDYLLIDRAKVR
jgi:hypothetical protein